jgi:hypothetical protein
MAASRVTTLLPKLLELQCPHVLPGEREEDLIELLTAASNQRSDILNCIIDNIKSCCKKLRSTGKSSKENCEEDLEEDDLSPPILPMSKPLGDNNLLVIQDLTSLGIPDASAFASATTPRETQLEIWSLLLGLIKPAGCERKKEDVFQLASEWSKKLFFQANYDVSSAKLIPRDIEKEVRSKFGSIAPNEKYLQEAVRSLEEESRALDSEVSAKDASSEAGGRLQLRLRGHSEEVGGRAHWAAHSATARPRSCARTTCRSRAPSCGRGQQQHSAKCGSHLPTRSTARIDIAQSQAARSSGSN